MPKYVKFIKDLLTKKKRIMDNETIEWRQVAVQSFIHAHAHAYLVIARSRIVSGHGQKSRQVNGRNQPR